jgi:hypothetical protein
MVKIKVSDKIYSVNNIVICISSLLFIQLIEVEVVYKTQKKIEDLESYLKDQGYSRLESYVTQNMFFWNS